MKGAQSPLSLRTLDTRAADFDRTLDALIRFEAAQDPATDRIVAAIVDDVRARGDVAVLEQHVLAGDAQVGGSVLHVRRDIGRAEDDERHAGALRRDKQLARRARILERHESRAREKRERFVEDAPFGERDRDGGQR